MGKTIRICAALALSALASTTTFAQAPQGGGGGAPGGQGGRGAAAPPMPMSFFITGAPKGDGANYGGIGGADAYCQQLGAAAGRGGVTWHAYMSTQAKDGAPAVNARDRIGAGPWYNQRGQMVARDLGTLHGDTVDQARVGNALGKQLSLSDKGMPVNGVGDMPNQHDILTGSRPDGTAYPDAADHTCNNWTSNSTGNAQLGHSDKQGGGNSSWNSAHQSAGCSQPQLVQTGGAGLLYCFAAN